MAAKIKTNYLEQLGSLTKRHLLVFINSRMRVFFTLMVPFIIFVIYIFFLRDLELMTIDPVLAEYGLSMEDEQLKHYVYTLIDSWMLSGIVAMCTITVSLQINNITVSDKENGINRDFASSPVSSNVLIFSYFLANFIITFVVCLVFLVACFIYLAVLGELIMTFTSIITMLGVLIFATINGVLFTVFICSFISRDSTMASIITIFSTAIGFLIGAYMPLFMMPEAVQYVCGFVPGTYSCALFRYAFMGDAINEMTEYVISVDAANGQAIMAQLTDSFGYNLNFFGYIVTPGYQALALVLFTILLLVLNILFGRKLTAVVGGMAKKVFGRKKKD
ncbi:MAG TPA: ABC transporter permease [Candidatus Coproplasma excrementipullorum]|nr:ABC transporter permease [Candidatus Coproplasma excrementipullorum]